MGHVKILTHLWHSAALPQTVVLGRVEQAILPAAGFSAGSVKPRIRLEEPAEKPAAARIGCPTRQRKSLRRAKKPRFSSTGCQACVVFVLSADQTRQHMLDRLCPKVGQR